MLEHGGRLRRAALQYGIPLGEWLDLSTGVAPYGLALPAIPEQVWNRLPELDDGLEAAACDYYGAARLLPVAGSQAAIQCLPRLRTEARVGIVSPAYAEHAAAWQREGHRVLEISEAGVNRALERLDVLLLVNPNNPTGRRFSPEQLYAWHARLAQRGGWLIVDEAFIDCSPEQSLGAHAHLPGLIVLRSFGKFFGMAGARLGFVLANGALLDELEEMLGPWTISGPTRWLATQMLIDRAGQNAQRKRLIHDGQRLANLLREHDLAPTGGCAMFQWIASEHAALLHEFLSCNGIFTRLFERPASIRFGLPPDEAGWQRLQRSLKVFAEEAR
ncbi:threonine-phosphate decarboxylase CobD [Phytopseudomonas punonensis]|uniref:threonine-phosphate decarboxylase n=1 Tax=Phytopseudomonas punonensis TaxID=1220495 RepID=A0A1M7NBJ1_9GAMM|nr:threonine-phosphate decarboxylase CobD [Pseudomonas punonensis]SHN01052.1 L-threonine O-3-phosphate decarboxylase [Pseudomonas punonensis]